MDSKIWSKTEDKFAHVLTLQGHDVHCLKVTGNLLTLKRNLKGVLEALAQGKPASAAGAKSVQSLDARSISKAVVSPGNDSLTLHGGPGGTSQLKYPAGSDANAILQEILAQSGQTFQTTEEEIGAVEALIPTVIAGVFAGLLWMGLNQTAGQLASGETVEAKGRRQGLKNLLIGVANVLGPNGTLALGVLLLVLIIGWAAKRLIQRPKRTVWLPKTT